MDNTSGLKTALDLEAKSSGGDREKAPISENFSLPLLPVPEKTSSGAEVLPRDGESPALTEAADDKGSFEAFSCLPSVSGEPQEVDPRCKEDALLDEEAENDPDCDYMTSRPHGKRGRPAGSRNKSTEKWRNYFLRQNKSPLMFLGSIYSQATDELAKELFVAREDALKYQISAATAVLPYVHQKLPLEIKSDDDKIPVLNIFMNKNEFNLTTDNTGQLKEKYKKIELVDDTEFKEILESDPDAKLLNKTNA